MNNKYSRHTATSLKNQFGSFPDAKQHFGLKARSWQALADKLNTPSVEDLKAQIIALEAQVAKLEAENKQLRANASTPAATITSYQEFLEETLRIYEDLNRDYNLGDLVPIYRIRRHLGDRISRPQFTEWLLEMQANDLVQLMGGVMQDSTADQREDSIMMPGGRIRFYVKRL
jgi:uncharacterized small protein (DUF1192 family)